MRAVVTRVKHASVTIEGKLNGQIGPGYLVLLGVGPNDTAGTAAKLAEKICNLRIFEDENGKMKCSQCAQIILFRPADRLVCGRMLPDQSRAKRPQAFQKTVEYTGRYNILCVSYSASSLNQDIYKLFACISY